MRWWLLALVLVALLSLTFTLLHPAPTTLGATLLGAIDRDVNTPPAPARGAIQVVDFTPDPAALRAIPTSLWTHGDGALPYTGIPSRSHSHWIQGAGGTDVEFTWQEPSSEPGAITVDPFRAALIPPCPAAASVRFAMEGQLSDAVENAIIAAQADLARLSDEELLQAWFKADRALLAQTDNLHDAVRQILLLKARPIVGPVVVLGALGHTYILPSAPLLSYAPPSNDTYVELDSYDPAGRFRWSGRLRIISPLNHPVEPERVRLVAARIAQFVNELSATSSSAPATRPGGFQFLHQPR